MTLAPGTVFAGFTIERTLGVGGMGTVYLAQHPRLPRVEALKLLRPELSYDPDFGVRFAREADMVARLDHPNIVGVNDRGVEDGQLWISMPYIDGMDAEFALAQCHGPMPAARTIHIVSQIAAALDFAHRNGLWHRDVKPANILLAPGHDSKWERVWLSDFGIAKAADEGVGLTKTGKVIATFDYASPEQIAGRAFDHRVDIYALGCVLYKLLTGSVPYPGTTLASALHGHVNLPPPRPTSRTPWLAPGLDQVIARAMAKDPDQRYPSCRALASAAQAAHGSLPDPDALPYSVSALRTDPFSGEPLTLGPFNLGFEPPPLLRPSPSQPLPASSGPLHLRPRQPTLPQPRAKLPGPTDGEQSRVRAALDQLWEDDGTQLFVVFVSTFDGLDGQTWADQSAQQSQLGPRDVLFAVAIDDRSYGISVDQDYPLTDQELDDLATNDVEPLLSDQDWAGAAIAMADGLRTTP